MTQGETNTEPLEAPHWPLVVWAARCSVYFLAQGGILLLSYAYFGFGKDPNSFAIGFRLDPILATVHFVWGLAGTFIGFYRPRYSTAFALAFAAFYTLLAALIGSRSRDPQGFGAGTSCTRGAVFGLIRTTNNFTGASDKFIPRWTTFGAT
jgi:hypothetical protein